MPYEPIYWGWEEAHLAIFHRKTHRNGNRIVSAIFNVGGLTMTGHPQTCVYSDVCLGIAHVSGKAPLPGQDTQCICPFRLTDSLGRIGQIHCVSARPLVPGEGLSQIHGQSLNTHRGKHRSGGGLTMQPSNTKTCIQFFAERGCTQFCTIKVVHPSIPSCSSGAPDWVLFRPTFRAKSPGPFCSLLSILVAFSLVFSQT